MAERIQFELSRIERSVWAHHWDHNARPDQRPPPDDWHVWLLLGGRGSGKTRAGAEWVQSQVRAGARRIALVGPTHHDAREVMLCGDSGLLNTGYVDERPAYHPTRRRLTWPNGAVGQLFSAHEADSLRGPQFDCAWGDEFCAWPDPAAVLSNLRLGLRLGDDPRLCLTTTPRPLPALDKLIAEAGTRVSRSRTRDNADCLAPGFLDAITGMLGETALARQELDGEIVRDHPGAVFTRAAIAQARVENPPPLDRVIVALDPPATSSRTSDGCGLVVVGAAGDHAYILQDATLPTAAPPDWAARAVDLFDAHGADAVLAETNQGGEMIATILRELRPDLPVIERHASRAKRTRALPVGMLYSRGRVHHVGRLDALEDELCAFGGPWQNGSPDRMDALVWAVTELLLGAPVPRVHFL